MQVTHFTTSYTVTGTLAETRHGKVYRVRGAADGCDYAMKQRTSGDVSEQREALERELAALQRLDSPWVLQAREVCDFDGKPSLVCDFVAGCALGANTELPFEVLLDVAQQAARALSHVHERGVVHNDVKPSNLLYDVATKRLTLIDFELASFGARHPVEQTVVEGSLPYLPPERTGRMNRLPDHRADFYSLGITLFELASGKLPYEANDALGWTHAHLSKTAPSLADVAPLVPRGFSNVVSKLLTKNPDERYQSAFGLLHDLERCAQLWEATRDISPFELGQRDISPVFRVSRTLIGRGAELQACSTALVEAARLLRVSGDSGTGKTAVVETFLDRARAQGCLVFEAAFEQHNQGRPYAALVTALERLADRVLVRSEAELERLRQSVADALGINTAVVVDFAPRLEQLLGPQPAPIPLSPTEAKHRLQSVLVAFLRVFSAPRTPAILSLDDCHWMDGSTAEVLEHLLAADLQGLLVVVTHRNVSQSHPVNKLGQCGGVRSVHVGNLDVEGIGELLAASFEATVEGVDELASVLHEKTDGNPFFLKEALEALASGEAFILDSTLGKWRWNLEKIRGGQVSGNVAVLMTERLSRLGDEGRSVLGAAACLGLTFEAAQVAELTGLPVLATHDALWQAAAERLISPLTSEPSDGPERAPRFCFPHSRVLDAAYAALSDESRTRLHRSRGSSLLQRWRSDAAAVSLFDVLHHLNAARSLLTQDADVFDLVELNLQGVERARATAAFEVARAYADIAAELVAARPTAPVELAFRVRYDLAEAVYLTRDFELARRYADACFEVAETPLMRGRIHALKAKIADHEADLLQAISEIRSGLAALNVHLPEVHSEIDAAIGPGIGKMQARLSEIQIEDLADLPTVSSAETALVLELLMQVVPPSIQTYPPLFILAELMMFDLELEHGVTAVSCKNFVDCGILQSSIIGNQDAAYRLGKVAFKLLERFKPTPLEAAVNFVFAGFVSHWKAHFREAEAAYEQAKRIGTELGDMQHVAYAYAHHTQRSLSVGRPLSDLAQEVDEALDYLRRGHHLGPAIGVVVAERAVARLCAKPGTEALVAEADALATKTVLDSNNAQWGYSYGQGQTMVSVLLRDRAAALRWQAFTRPFALAAASLFSVPDYHLFDALVELWNLPDVDPLRSEGIRRVEVALEKLEGWAKAAPENFAHKYELLKAEHARVTGQPLENVLDGYQRCIETAGHEFPQFRAMANELEADLWLSRGAPRRARPALEEAYRLYGVWGATANTVRLERQHPWLAVSASKDDAAGSSAVSPTTTTRSSALDAESILKATQAISKEVETQKLFAALMTTLIESAGAQHGCLVLESDVDRRLYVEARANVEGQDSGVVAEALEDAADVCASVVRYVLRTREAVSLDDAREAGPFQNDDYIARHRVRSLLCVPILRQGQVLGCLYLENNKTTHAFTRERVGLLQVIASQAAISIHNAQLYTSLEHRVRERTAELAQKNRQIAAMLDNMDQGVFTIDSQLRILPGYSRHLEQILGASELVGKQCMSALFEGASLRPDELNAAAGALQFSFGVETWLAETNACHLIREFQRGGQSGATQYFEVDWNYISDEQDVVERVLVVVRDVTVLRQLQQSAAERGREADIVAQVIDTGVEVFEEFAAAARNALAENGAALQSTGVPTVEELTRSFRNLHTLKGNARLLGYTHVVDALHDAEEHYDLLRRSEGEEPSASSLREGLDAVQQVIDGYAAVTRSKLVKLTGMRDRRLEDALRDIVSIVDTAAPAANANALDDVAKVLQRLQGSALSELVLETSRLVPSLAAELGKPTPVVETAGGGVLLAKPWAASVKDILVQCFRNSLFHGLEADEERRAAGKRSTGWIGIEARTIEEGLEVLIQDDGRGLALDVLRQHPDRGDWTDEQLAECVFQSGVSTAREVGLVAGRGVGLDIVREVLRRGGGDVSIRFTADERGGFRRFALVLRLPAEAVLQDAPSAQSSGTQVAAE